MQSSKIWASRFLDERGCERIKEAVTLAEQRSAGQIVPVLVSHSAVLGHVAPLLILLFVLFLLPITFFFGTDAWLASAFLVLIAVLMGHGLSLVPLVQRFVTTRADLHQQVITRAWLEFYESGFVHDSPGVLILVSFLEKDVVVLTSRLLADQVAPEIWGEARDRILAGMRRRDLAGGMVEAIRFCGEIMEKQVPVQVQQPLRSEPEIIRH